LNAPPVVWKICTGTEREPGEYVAVFCKVYQRWPAAPEPAPLGAYVYQATKTAAELGFTSTVKPWPEVAAVNQFPEKPKSAFVGRALVVEHVSFCNRRVNGMVPVRPDPSVNVYAS
jgi:hypothetical protein